MRKKRELHVVWSRTDTDKKFSLTAYNLTNQAIEKKEEVNESRGGIVTPPFFLLSSLTECMGRIQHARSRWWAVVGGLALP